MNTIAKDIIIVGAGPAGLAAAIAAKQQGVQDILVLERDSHLGGILQQCIHNGFGLHRFNEELTGPEYAARDIEQAKRLQIDMRTGVTVLDVSGDKIVTAISEKDGVVQYKAKAVVLAMGCRERPRGALAIPGTRPAGIYSAGTAQKFMNMQGYRTGKRIVVLGSGDIGLIMARRMTLQGAKVLACVEIMPYSSGLNRNIVQCLNDYDIPLYLEHTVTDIQGKDRVESVTVSKVDKNRRPIPGSEFNIKCDTLLLSVGLIPENELSRGARIKLSPATNGAVVNNHFETSRPGIFACGNVLHVHDLVDNVSEESFIAGRMAAEYVQSGEESKAAIPVLDGTGVRGCVPQTIFADEQETVHVMFRPDNVYKNHFLTLFAGDIPIQSRKKMILTPGEMVNMPITHDMLEKIKEQGSLKIAILPEKAV